MYYKVFIIILLVLGLLWLYLKHSCTPTYEKLNIPNDLSKINIPHIIHQTWKTHQLPPNFEKYVSSWKNLQDYTHILYNDQQCTQFISQHYPQYLGLFKELEKGVQRADVFRYLVIHKYGGVYADIDTICTRDITPLLQGHRMVVGVEYEPKYNNGRTQYLQWFFASVPGNDILLGIVDNIQQRLDIKKKWGTWFPLVLDGRRNTELDRTLWLTGPFVFSDCIEPYTKHIKVYPRCILGSYDRTPGCRQKGYLIHGFEGTWKSDWNETRKRY